MKPIVRQLDEVISRTVVRLPANLKRPADVIGYAFVPWTWLVILAIFALASIGSDSFVANLLVVVLIPFATIIKFAFRRKRPPTIYAGNMRIKSYSFPSSHAYSAALGAGYLASIALSEGMSLVGVALILLAFVIGISRIYLGAHYPSDVVGGWLTAVIILVMVSLL